MKTFPMFLSAGLLCAGLAIGCAESDAPTKGSNTVDPTEAAWMEDDGVTKAHLNVTGMT